MEIKKIINLLTEKIKPLLMDNEDSNANEESEEGKEQGNAPTSLKKYTSKDILAAIFNGLGVGLLLGLLLGLAVSPVVSAFIGTLSSLLVVLLGLNEKLFTVVKSFRIGSFGLFAVAGILLGFYIRSYSPLAPSLSDLKEEYIALGYEDSVAKNILLFQEFNLIPKDWMGRLVQPKPAADGDTTDSGDSKITASQPMMAQNVNVSKRNNILFSSSVDVGECDMLEYSNVEMGFDRLKKNFETAGGTWKEMAENMDSSLPDQVKANTLIIIRDVFCNSEATGTVKINCVKFEQPLTDISLDNLTAELRKSDPLWGQIISRVETSIDKQYQQNLYLSLINIFCHD